MFVALSYKLEYELQVLGNYQDLVADTDFRKFKSSLESSDLSLSTNTIVFLKMIDSLGSFLRKCQIPKFK